MKEDLQRKLKWIKYRWFRNLIAFLIAVLIGQAFGDIYKPEIGVPRSMAVGYGVFIIIAGGLYFLKVWLYGKEKKKVKHTI